MEIKNFGWKTSVKNSGKVRNLWNFWENNLGERKFSGKRKKKSWKLKFLGGKHQKKILEK